MRSYRDEFPQNSRSFHPYSSSQRVTSSSSSSSNPWASSTPPSIAFRPPSHTHRHLAFGRPRSISDTTPVPTESLIVPPPLRRPQSIPLPPLSAVEVEVNPILLVTGIEYNIRAPTSFAECPSRRHTGRDAWRYEAAVRPPVASLTIFLDFDPHRPIVVFPTNRCDNGVITVSDVLDAVMRRVGVVAEELREAYRAGYAVQPMRREVWWVGLVPSLGERDVWVLRTM